MKTKNVLIAVLAAILILTAGIAIGANKFGRPNTILHVITCRLKPDTTPEQKQAVVKAIEKMAAEIPGIKNIWTKGIKVQGDRYTDAYVMEFANKAAFDAYVAHPAHKVFEDVYLPVREQSTTHDITNE